MTEKELNGKEMQSEKEIDPKLKELIEIMKVIDREMPNVEKEERITVFLEYARERKCSNFVTEKATNTMNIGSLLNSLSFKQSKNGKSEFVNIDKELGERLPQRFDYGEYSYFNKGDALIRVKNNSKQKKDPNSTYTLCLISLIISPV